MACPFFIFGKELLISNGSGSGGQRQKMMHTIQCIPWQSFPFSRACHDGPWNLSGSVNLIQYCLIWLAANWILKDFRQWNLVLQILILEMPRIKSRTFWMTELWLFTSCQTTNKLDHWQQISKALGRETLSITHTGGHFHWRSLGMVVENTDLWLIRGRVYCWVQSLTFWGRISCIQSLQFEVEYLK